MSPTERQQQERIDAAFGEWVRERLAAQKPDRWTQQRLRDELAQRGHEVKREWVNQVINGKHASDDLRRAVEGILGRFPEPAAADPVSADLADAIRQQADAIRELVAEVRSSHVQPQIQPANVVPSRDKKTRRVHWLAIAMARRGWTSIPQAAKEIGRSSTIVGQWLNGTTVPRGAELTNLARALDIPTALIVDPPATDAERLASWHVDTDESRLRQAM
jgi:transposase